jgi:hypothetical protein
VEIFERLLPGHWWTDPNESIGGLPYPAHQRLIARAAKWTLGLASTGLLLLLFRWQLVPFLSKRLWLYLWCLAIIGVIAYAVQYWRRSYPRDLADWEDAERRRRYLPKPGQGGSRSRRRSRRRR